LNIKTFDKKKKSEAEIVVEIDPEEFETAVAKAFIKNKNKVTVPGFRKGKAPRRIIERMYGATIFHADAFEILVPDVLEFMDNESGFKIVGAPSITDVDVKENNAGADFTFTASLYPEVTLGEYKGLSAAKPDAEVPESVIDAELADLRLRNARIEKVDRPAALGDVAVFDFEGFVDGEPFEGGKADNYELELGSNSFIQGFEEKMLGMSTGEERELDLVFPDEYAEHLAGKPVVFKVRLNELREKQMPDLDDEFAKDVSEFDTLKEYKADIRAKHEKTKHEESDSAFENSLMDMIVESMEAEIPDAMVDVQQDIATKNFIRQLSAYGIGVENYLNMTGMTPEEFGATMREKSVQQVKVALALEKIAELEGIEVSGEDVEKEYNETAERYGMELDKLKETLKEKDVMADLRMRRAAKIVTESAIALDPDSAPRPSEQDEKGSAGGKKAAAKPKKPAAKNKAAAKPDEDEPAETDKDN